MHMVSFHPQLLYEVIARYLPLFSLGAVLLRNLLHWASVDVLDLVSP